MKTQFKLTLCGVALCTAFIWAACTNPRSNNASYAADTINKNHINRKDTTPDDKADTAQKKLDAETSNFLVKSYEAGLYQIELGQLAATRATNAGIKDFARRIIPAHKNINTKLLNLAIDAGFKLPGGIDSDHAKKLKELDKKNGADFDKAFTQVIADEHQQAVESYTKASQKLPASAAKAFATSTLPQLQEHLAIAKKLKEEFK